MSIHIRKLIPELLKDYLYFFDNMDFGKRPEWSACYCYSFHFTGRDDEWNKDSNRAAVSSMIKDGTLNGYLAFSNNIPVGWCNAGNKHAYQALHKWHPEIPSDPNRSCSIVCFLIHPDFRGKKIATLLLEEVVANCQSDAYHYIEAYPGKNESTCEGHYKGPLSMYEKQGFKIIAEFEDYYIVRKKLRV